MHFYNYGRQTAALQLGLLKNAEVTSSGSAAAFALEKTARKKSLKELQERNSVFSKGLMLGIAPTLAAQGAAVGGIALDKYLASKNPHEAVFTSPQHVINTVGPALGLDPLEIYHETPTLKQKLMTMGAPYAATKDTWPLGHSEILAPEKGSPGALAHEVGHLSGKQIPGSVYMGNIYNMLAGLVIPQTELFLDPDSMAAKVLPYASVAPAVPRLIEEGRASVQGYNALRRLGYGRKALLGLIPAGATYLTGALAPGLSAEYIRRKKKEKGLD